MSSHKKADPRIRVAEFDRIAAGQQPADALVRALVLDPSARKALAERDPSAIFSVLSSLPLSGPLPARPIFAPRRRRSGLRASLAAAAALLVVVGAMAVSGSRLENNPQAAFSAAVESAGVDPYYQVVSHVDSPTAQVIVLVPPSAKGPTVTLILDEEVDL